MEEFISTKISEIGKVITGKTPPTMNRENYGGEYLFISPNELHDGYKIETAEKTITEAGINSIKNNIIEGISVLVGCIGWDMGNVAMVHQKCATNQQINAITNFNDKYDPYYVYYWLTQKKDYLFSIASVTRTPILSKSTFEDIEIPIPSKAKQIKISHVLKKIDDKIQTNKKINDNLWYQANSLFDYWFKQYDFPNNEGQPYKSTGGAMNWNEEIQDYIPKNWTCGNLYDIADFINGLACQKYRPKANEDSLPVIKIREMHDGITVDTEAVSASIPDKNILANGDILFSWSATLEVMYWFGGKAGLNQHIFKVNPIKVFPKEYVYHQLSDYVFKFVKMAEARKTTMGHITTDHIRQSRIVIPPVDLLKQFSTIAFPIHEKIGQCNIENIKMTSLRDWLLPMLMNGQATIED